MREQSKWRETEKCGWRRFALVHVGWMTGQESPSPPSKPGCPPQAASHRGWSWVRWGTGLPLWFGFLGIKRQNYVMSGKCRTNGKHRPPVNSTFSFFINLLVDLLYFSILNSALSLIFRLPNFFTRMLVLQVLPWHWFWVPFPPLFNYCSECHLYVVCSLDPSQCYSLFYLSQILHLAILWASQTYLDKMKPWLPSPAWFEFQ